MYAVIKTGGKQYVVRPNQKLEVEKLALTAGDTVTFPVLSYKPEGSKLQIGTPYVPNIQVKASIVDQIRGDKIRIIKFKRRKHHRKQMGHRQYYTVLQINEIEG
jgi:large subunit ribosomal protein L21